MKTIVWDVDDVLNDLMCAWFEHWASGRGDVVSLSYDRLTRNPPHELLGIDKFDYLTSLDAFRLSGRVEKLQPVPEVLAWLGHNGDRCRHIALTAVPLKAGHVSAGWVMSHFGRWIRSFNMTPSPRAGEETAGVHHATKTDFLRWWAKGDILVDDSEENVAGARSLGMEAVLFPRPWNSSPLTIGQSLAKLTELAG